MKPPRKIALGPIDYAVQVDAAKCRSRDVKFGEVDRVVNTVLLNPEQSPSSMRDTLLHELLHAALDTACLISEKGFPAPLRTDADEERLVRALTPYLLGLLRDNPRLVAFLTERD